MCYLALFKRNQGWKNVEELSKFIKDNYNQSVVDDVYKKYYDTLSEYIQGHYSSEIYRLYSKLKK